MARPRSNKPQRKGSGTSFGKRSDAEKAFRKRKPSAGRDDEGKRSFSKPGFSTPGFSRDSGKPAFRKSSGSFTGRPKRSDEGESGSRARNSGPSFRPRRSDESGDSKPYRSGPPKPWQKAGERPERSADRGDFKKSVNKPGGFAKDRGDGDFKKPFTKREGGDFKKPYAKRDGDDSGFKKPYAKRDGDDCGFKKPYAKRDGDDSGFKKPYAKRDGDDSKRPFRKSGDFPKRADGPRKSFDKDGERKSFVQSRVTSLSDFTKPGRKPKNDAPEAAAEPKGDALIRLNKYVANSGVGSRREADKLITMGLISVNGKTITELGTKVKMSDTVRYEERVLKAEKPVYILLNKPKGFITTTDDPQERSTVMNLVAGACKERIYPVGRLDRNTTGLLLLTNDGDLADKLTHPSYEAKKVYKAELDKPLTKNDFQKILEGVQLEEGRAKIDDLAIISDDSKTVGLEIHIGWNRVVRRIFETLGYTVVKLDRSVYAGLDKKDTPRGTWRFLKPEEIVMLKHFK